MIAAVIRFLAALFAPADPPDLYAGCALPWWDAASIAEIRRRCGLDLRVLSDDEIRGVLDGRGERPAD